MRLFDLRRRAPRLGLVGVVAVLALAGCGGDDEEPAAGGGGSQGGGEEITAEGPLTIGGWGGAYNEATQEFYLDPFQEETGVEAQFVDAPGTQLARAQAQAKSGNVEWDLIDSIAGAEAFIAYDKGLFEPLPADLKARLVKTLGEAKVSDFGFTMGNLGNAIVCNMDNMDVCPKTMAEFFDVQKFPQDRMFAGFGPLEIATIAMVANGTPPQETATTPVDIDAVFKTLERVKPKIKVFWESGDQQEQLIRGEVDMGIMWTGRAYRVADTGVPLEVNIDGAGYEPGYWAVLKDAPNKDAAFALMEWIATNPEEQAGWAQALNYSVPNPEALDHMPEEAAQQLVDNPENFERLAVPNWDWYVDNADELNRRWQDFLRG